MTSFIHHGAGKRQFTRQMFSQIVDRYDFLNRSLSLGMDQKWRSRLLDTVNLQPGFRMLDLACGTGDVSKLAGKRTQPGLVVGADPVPPMLQIAARKCPSLKTVCCEGEALPFGHGTFDAITVAFGVRNFSDLEMGLQEIYRVLLPGGILAILEFALPSAGIFRGFFAWYLKHVLPFTGALFRRGEAYHYLTESIYHFPSAPEFVRLLGDIGLVELYREQYLGGTVQIVTGRKSTQAI
ncbi:ubiquinone/menaquinone biosynthesis methyltransferase [Candidatus Neomarinimicrobiota bacterium]